MADQLEIIPPFLAEGIAAKLGAELHEADNPFVVFLAFGEAMMRSDACKKYDYFEFIQVVGFGVVNECHVWWMLDDSIMLTGWKEGEADALAIGVLPPGSDFTSVPLTTAGNKTVH